jgi:carbon starvation protein CstA
MGLYKQLGFDAKMVGTAPVIGIIARQMLGPVGGIIAIIGIIILPITSGDTGLRALRLIVGDTLKIDQKKLGRRLGLSAVIFMVVALILFWAKSSVSGFSVLWRYFAWSNQTLATFTFGFSTVYLIVANKHKNAYLVALLPGSFYLYTILTFILNSKIGFNLPWNITYPLGGVLTVVAVYWVVRHARTFRKLDAVAMA